MPLLSLVAFAFLLFEDNDFFATLVFEHGGHDGSAFQDRSAESKIFAFAGGEDFLYFKRRTLGGIRVAVHREYVALGNGELAALGFDRGFHYKKGRIKQVTPAGSNVKL